MFHGLNRFQTCMLYGMRRAGGMLSRRDGQRMISSLLSSIKRYSVRGSAGLAVTFTHL